jgi:hypothetical protein
MKRLIFIEYKGNVNHKYFREFIEQTDSLRFNCVLHHPHLENKKTSQSRLIFDRSMVLIVACVHQ